LVQDRVDGDRGLAGLAVTNDEFALTTADRGHRVDHLDAGLHRLLDRLALDDARRLDLHATLTKIAGQRTFAVDRLAERVEHAAEDTVADRNLEDLAGGLDRLTFLDMADFAEHHGADRILVEVQRKTEGPAFELEKFVDARAGQAADAGDTVAHFEDAANLLLGDLRIESVKALAKGGGDVIGIDRQLGHGGPGLLRKCFNGQG
jgi:hypothetical protein